MYIAWNYEQRLHRLDFIERSVSQKIQPNPIIFKN